MNIDNWFWPTWLGGCVGTLFWVMTFDWWFAVATFVSWGLCGVSCWRMVKNATGEFRPEDQKEIEKWLK